MQKINEFGFKISQADQKALDHYLLETPKEWAHKALLSMINKAKKTVLNDWLEKYKAISGSEIPATESILITNILAMQEFVPYKTKHLKLEKAQRDEEQTIEIWVNGFDIEDWEYTVLQAFYDDPEKELEDLMENKIAMRKKAFVKEFTTQMIADPTIENIPSRHDAFINLVTSDPEYKNRAEKENGE